MSWMPLAPPVNQKARRRVAAVKMAVVRAQGGAGPRLHIAVYNDQLRFGPIPWWTVGAKVSVMLGQSDHAGTLRITPSGPFLLTAFSGGRGASIRRTPILRMELLPGMAADPREGLPVEFDYSDDWLEITLPDWAKPAAAPAPAPRAMRQPFRIGANGAAERAPS